MPPATSKPPKPPERARISNVKRRVWLPDDVIDLIFETMVTDPTLDWSVSFKFRDIKVFVEALRMHQPCNYLLVCRQWTNVILNNRSLWTTILVDPWSIQDHGFEPIYAKVKAHIKHSGNRPLNAVFICGVISYSSRSDTAMNQREDQLELLRLLAGKTGQVAARWRTCIVAWQGTVRSRRTENLSLTFPMPQLTSLCIWGWPSGAFPTDCFATTPALRHISGGSSTIKAWSGHTFSELITLEMSNRVLDSPFTVLPCLQSVTILKLVVPPSRSEELSFIGQRRLYDIEQVSLPKVVEFAVHGVANAEFLSKFKLEGLRSLSFRLETTLVAESDPLLAAVEKFASPKIVKLDLSIDQPWADRDKLVDLTGWTINFLETLPNVEKVTGTSHFLRVILNAKKRKGWILPLAEISPPVPKRKPRRRKARHRVVTSSD